MATSRGSFVGSTVLGAGLVAASAPRPWQAQTSPSDTLNLGVVGFRSRGRTHIRQFARMSGVREAYLCDVDERLFPDAVAEVEQIRGYTPQTETDIRHHLANISFRPGRKLVFD